MAAIKGPRLYLGSECKMCQMDWQGYRNPEHPVPGVGVPRCGANSWEVEKEKQNNQGLSITLVCELMSDG